MGPYRWPSDLSHHWRQLRKAYSQMSFFAASLAVGLAVGIMYYCKCIHPPGGATALTAVVGGNTVHDMGYQFVLTPVFINVIAILFVAITFNAFFKWRRYPSSFANKPTAVTEEENTSANHYNAITHEDFVSALSEFDSFIGYFRETTYCLFII